MTPEQQELLRQHDEHQKQLFIEAVEKGEDIQMATERIEKETREEWRKLLTSPENDERP